MEYNNGLYVYNNKKYDKCVMFDINDCEDITNIKKIISCDKNTQLICFTNFHSKNLELIENKIKKIIKFLDTAIIFYFTIEFNKYEKPYTTILKHIQNINCFYGSNETNFKFAINCNISFMNINTFQLEDLNNRPINYPILVKNNITIKHEFFFELNNIFEKDLILLVGYPASGKSFVANYLKNKYDYFVLSLDNYLLKNRFNINDIENIIVKHKKIIIDYCCIKPIRKKFIIIGKKYEYHIRSIHIDLNIDLLKHNSYYRYLTFDREISKEIYNIKLQLDCNHDEEINEIIKLNNIFINDVNYYKYTY